MACATARFGKTYGAFPLLGRAKVCAIRQRPALRIFSCLDIGNDTLSGQPQPTYCSHRLNSPFVRVGREHDACHCAIARLGRGHLSLM